MDKYIILCTEEQIRKAYELGAHINFDYYADDFQNAIKVSNKLYAEVPTAEEMIGWLEEQGYYIEIRKSFIADFQSLVHNDHITIFYGECFLSRKEATLVAIDAVLDYLENIRQ